MCPTQLRVKQGIHIDSKNVKVCSASSCPILIEPNLLDAAGKLLFDPSPKATNAQLDGAKAML